MSSEPPRRADVVRHDVWMHHHSTSFTVQMSLWVAILLIVCACGVVLLPAGSAGAVVVGSLMLAVGVGCLLLSVRYLRARVRVNTAGVEVRNAWRSRTVPLDRVSHFTADQSIGLPSRTGGGSCDSVALLLTSGRKIGLSAFERSPSEKHRDPPYYADIATALTELLNEVRAR